MNNQNKNFLGLSLTQLFHIVMDIFVSTFLTANIFKITGSAIQTVLYSFGLYGICYFGFLGATFLFRYIRKVNMLRISAILTCAVIFCAIDETFRSNSYILIGILYGLGSGVYWASIRNIEGTVYQNVKSKNYVFTYKIADRIIKILFPITLGALITFASFALTTTIVAVIAALQIASTFIISSDACKKSELKPREFLTYVREKNLKKPLISVIFINFFSTVADVLPICFTMLVMTVYGEYFDLGALGTIFTASTAILLVLYAFLRGKSRNLTFLIGSALPFLISFLILLPLGELTLILVNGSYVVFRSLTSVEQYRIEVDLPKNLGLESYISETYCFVQFGVFSGRVILFGLLALITAFAPAIAFQLYLIVLSLLLLARAISIHLWNKKYKKRELVNSPAL
jgi:hypothetical protein